MTAVDGVDLVTLEIDGREVRVPKGTFILHAARDAGIHIPTFCEYPDLRPFGACRMCMVEIETKRGTTTDIACSTPVSAGMKVSTRSEKVREAERFVVESLLVDHPLECPVCDKSGECDLQNNAYLSQVRVDNPLRRPKQSWELEVLSESVSIKRDRCVLCGRCVRVCDELVGSTALSWARRGFTSYIDASFGTDLKESPCVSCGLCIEVCPVGALLNTSYHDTARAWFLTRYETVCGLCGVGCNLQLHVEQATGNLQRVMAANDTGINNQQLCARGFFSYESLQSEARLRTPLVRRDGELRPASWEDALAVVAERLPNYRGDRFGALAGPHCTNEDNYLFAKLVRASMHTNNIDFDTGGARGVPEAGLADALGRAYLPPGFEDVWTHAGAVLLLGSNLSATHPVFTYRLQTEVRRRGAKLLMATPAPVPLTQAAAVDLRYLPGTEAALLAGIAASGVRQGLVLTDGPAGKIDGFADWLAEWSSVSPDWVADVTGVPRDLVDQAALLYFTGGSGIAQSGAEYPASAIFFAAPLTSVEGGELIEHAAANLALLSGSVDRSGGGVAALQMAANGQGALDMGCAPFLLPGGGAAADGGAGSGVEAAWGRAHPLPTERGLSLQEMLGAAAAKRLRAMYIMGSNPVGAAEDSSSVRSALAELDFLVVQDTFLTPSAELADVVLPAASWAEKDGTFTSAERRVQRLHRGLRSSAQSRPDWEIVAELLVRLGPSPAYLSWQDVFREITTVVPGYGGLELDDLERPVSTLSPRPGKAYRADALTNRLRPGVRVQLGETGSSGAARRRLVPLSAARLSGVLRPGYREALETSLYRQGSGAMTDPSPTLVSLHVGGAADSSLERGRGVGILRGPHLELSGYSTGQLTEI